MQVAVGDTILSPLDLHDYLVLRKTRTHVIAQRTVIITPESVSDYLVFRNVGYDPIVFQELKLGERVTLGSPHDLHTVAMRSSTALPCVIAVDIRVIDIDEIKEWVPNEF